MKTSTSTQSDICFCMIFIHLSLHFHSIHFHEYLPTAVSWWAWSQSQLVYGRRQGTPYIGCQLVVGCTLTQPSTMRNLETSSIYQLLIQYRVLFLGNTRQGNNLDRIPSHHVVNIHTYDLLKTVGGITTKHEEQSTSKQNTQEKGQELKPQKTESQGCVVKERRKWNPLSVI